MEQISSKENQNVKEYGKLVSSKSHRDKTGRFGIESVKLVLEAAASGIELEKVFVTDQCFKNILLHYKSFLSQPAVSMKLQNRWNKK